MNQETTLLPGLPVIKALPHSTTLGILPWKPQKNKKMYVNFKLPMHMKTFNSCAFSFHLIVLNAAQVCTIAFRKWKGIGLKVSIKNATKQ